MQTNNDTIAAVSTPPGVGGIAVVRVSGPEAIRIVNGLWRGKDLTAVASHTVHLGTLLRTDGSVLDQCVATVFHGPKSYTGEDVVELSVHGSVYVQRTVVAELCNAGARAAEPGEFTRRAFAAGKIDLVQAESIADILSAESAAAHDMAIKHLKGGFSKKIEGLRAQLIDLSALLELELDFSEEDVEFADRERLIAVAGQIARTVESLHEGYSTGSAIKNGIPIAIVGPANAGKSSLFNALVGDDRAIVSDIHGTTRDIVDDTIIIGRHSFRIMDTAGLRHTDDTIEKIGIERSLKAVAKATIVLYVTSPDAPDLNDTAHTSSYDSATIRQAAVPDHTSSRSASLNQTAASSLAYPDLSQEISDTEDTLSVNKVRRLMSPGSILIHVRNKADLIASPVFVRPKHESPSVPAPGTRLSECESDLSTKHITEHESSPSSKKVIEYEASLSTTGNDTEVNGIALLKNVLEEVADSKEADSPTLLISNPRQEQALKSALEAANETLQTLRDDLPTVIVSQSLRATITALDTLTGQIATPTILQSVFTRFCIGK